MNLAGTPDPTRPTAIERTRDATAPQRAAARVSAQRSFAMTLGQRIDESTGPALDEAQKARQAAEGLVSQTFIQPMLKLLRQSDRSAPPFAAGPGERQFRALMDAELSNRIVSASRFPLVDRLAAELTRRGAAGEEPALPNVAPGVASAIDAARAHGGAAMGSRRGVMEISR